MKPTFVHAIAVIAVIAALALVSGCTSYQSPYQSPSPQRPSSAAPQATTGVEKTVEITAAGFNPAMAEINAGDTVTWINMDTAPHWPASAVHPTHRAYPEAGGCIGSSFDACKNLTQGESFSFTFNQPGEWKYHDHRNCCTNPAFFGTVVVK